MSMANPVQWRVTAVVDTTGKDSSGQFVPGKQVTYQIAAGPTETVFVPGNPPTADMVAEMIRERAANLDAINSLTSGY